MSKLLIILVACSLHAANVYRIACGSSTGGADAQGQFWQSDAYFTGGASFSRADMAALGLPYKALRNGASFSYSIPLPNGEYTVKLYWAENRTAASSPPIGTGQRQFAVSVAGALAVPSLDLFATAGSLMPYSLTFPVSVSTGTLSISETAAAGSLGALLSGISVDSVDAPPPLPFAPYFVGLESAPPACPSGLAFLVATDTNHLLWCVGGSAWHPIGDFSAGPSIFHLQALDACQSSSGAWDCSGTFRAMISRDDGGATMSLVGIDLTVSGAAYPPITWAPAK